MRRICNVLHFCESHKWETCALLLSARNGRLVHSFLAQRGPSTADIGTGRQREGRKYFKALSGWYRREVPEEPPVPTSLPYPKRPPPIPFPPQKEQHHQSTTQAVTPTLQFASLYASCNSHAAPNFSMDNSMYVSPTKPTW